MSSKPDLDSSEHIQQFLSLFYGKLLADDIMAPIFLEVAGIDLRVHLGHIQHYWEKLLLGGNDYQRHTMNIHRALHAKRALTTDNFTRWLHFFTSSVDEAFAGPNAEQAKRVATHITENMRLRIVDNDYDTQPHHHAHA